MSVYGTEVTDPGSSGYYKTSCGTGTEVMCYVSRPCDEDPVFAVVRVRVCCCDVVVEECEVETRMSFPFDKSVC